jgi:hypothetical protein
MKIQLPNPNDYLHKEDQFWEQLELAIYHAKKSWEKIKKTYSSEDEKNDLYPWIAFTLPSEIENALDDATNEKGLLIDPNYEKRQEISISIEEL